MGKSGCFPVVRTAGNSHATHLVSVQYCMQHTDTHSTQLHAHTDTLTHTQSHTHDKNHIYIHLWLWHAMCMSVHECGCGLVLFTSFTAILCVCWQLLRVKSYWILFMVFGCGLAVFTSITTFLEQILCPRGYSNVSIFSQPPHIPTLLPHPTPHLYHLWLWLSFGSMIILAFMLWILIFLCISTDFPT